MTDRQDHPAIRQRRRVTQLHNALGRASVPPHVGTELRQIAPHISEQVVPVSRHDPASLALSPDGQRLLLSAVARAVDEFARLVEGRPTQAPPVEALLVEIVRIEGQLEPCRAAVHAASQTLREVTRALWPQLPQARPFCTRLDTALARYSTGICAKAMGAPQSPAARHMGGLATSTRPADGLLALVERRWGTQPVQLYLTVRTRGATEGPAQQGAARRHVARAPRSLWPTTPPSCCSA